MKLFEYTIDIHISEFSVTQRDYLVAENIAEAIERAEVRIQYLYPNSRLSCGTWFAYDDAIGWELETVEEVKEIHVSDPCAHKTYVFNVIPVN